MIDCIRSPSSRASRKLAWSLVIERPGSMEIAPDYWLVERGHPRGEAWPRSRGSGREGDREGGREGGGDSLDRLMSLLRDCLRSFPESDREVFRLHFHEGCSPGRIVLLLGLSPGEVRSVIDGGLARIQRTLDEEDHRFRGGWRQAMSHVAGLEFDGVIRFPGPPTFHCRPGIGSQLLVTSLFLIVIVGVLLLGYFF